MKNSKWIIKFKLCWSDYRLIGSITRPLFIIIELVSLFSFNTWVIYGPYMSHITYTLWLKDPVNIWAICGPDHIYIMIQIVKAIFLLYKITFKQFFWKLLNNYFIGYCYNILIGSLWKYVCCILLIFYFKLHHYLNFERPLFSLM